MTKLGSFMLGVVIGAVGLLLCIKYYPEEQNNRHPHVEIKSGIHAIQVALERYAADHDGVYPSNTDELLFNGYMGMYPPNVVGFPTMTNVPLGSHNYPGNFTYIPDTEDGIVSSYVLLGYGMRDDEGWDYDQDGAPDHVIIEVQGPKPDKWTGFESDNLRGTGQ